MSGESDQRLARQRELMAARSQGVPIDAALPPPPYHVRDVEMLYVMCRFDVAEVAAIVPDGLTPSGNGWGVIAMYTVPSGWGIAPYTGFFMAVELEGLDSNDGSPGMYMHSGFYSGVGGRVMQTIYNSNFRVGWSRREATSSSVVTEAGIAQQPLVRMSADLVPGIKPLNGISRYIGRRPEGGFNSYSVSFSMEMQDAIPKSVDFLEGAESVVKALRPLEFVWPIYVCSMAMSFTPPRPLDDAQQYLADDARNVGLLGIFSRMRRAAAIVQPDGALVTMNTNAEALVRQGLLTAGSFLAPARTSEATAFRHLLAGAAANGSDLVSERMALSGADGRSIIAQVLCLDPSIAGPGRLLVFFDDPAREADSDPAPALQLLGLTPAETRIASLVGSGRSPREAADALEISLNTVRSALKIVFDKLGISRQSELAKIVARLAG